MIALRCYWAIVEKSTDGFYALLPDLPGATAAGDSVVPYIVLQGDGP
jgi:hypothetical protein